MATILDTIVKHKLTEIQLKKELLPIKYVEQSPLLTEHVFR